MKKNFLFLAIAFLGAASALNALQEQEEQEEQEIFDPKEFYKQRYDEVEDSYDVAEYSSPGPERDAALLDILKAYTKIVRAGKTPKNVDDETLFKARKRLADLLYAELMQDTPRFDDSFFTLYPEPTHLMLELIDNYESDYEDGTVDYFLQPYKQAIDLQEKYERLSDANAQELYRKTIDAIEENKFDEDEKKSIEEDFGINVDTLLQKAKDGLTNLENKRKIESVEESSSKRART